MNAKPAAEPRARRIRIFDVTLSEGRAAAMTVQARLRIAEMLDGTGADVIEAGFPAISRRHFDEVKEIASVIANATVCAKARAEMFDIDRAADAIGQTPRRRIRIVTGIGPWYRRHELNMSPAQLCRYVDYAVRRARRYTDDVEWTASDAMRAEPDVLRQVVEAAINAGAATIGLAGGAPSSVYSTLLQWLRKELPRAHRVAFSTDCGGGAQQIYRTIGGFDADVTEEEATALSTDAPFPTCLPTQTRSRFPEAMRVA
jgi:2-isopropylmalate synthase